MSEEPHLLPRNATSFEKAVSVAAAQGTDLPAHLVNDVTDPWTCPAEFLPFLALERSVDLWDPDWPIERQRWVIAEQARLHRLKTTEAGFRAHLALVGAELVRTITPRSDFFAAPEFGDEDRQAWVRQFPQIRIRSFAREGFDRVTALSGPADHADTYLGADDGPSFFADDGLNPGEALGRQAVLYRGGMETPLIWSEVTTGDGRFHEQLILPGNAGNLYFSDDVGSQDHLADPDTPSRIISFAAAPQETIGGYAYNLVRPSLTPLTTWPERVTAEATDDVSLFSDDMPIDLVWLVESRARFRIYDSIRLFERDRPSQLPLSTDFVDNARFRLEPYTAELTVRIVGRKPEAALEFVDDHLVEDDTLGLLNAVDAVRISQSVRDTIHVNSRLHTPIRFGDGRTFKSLRLGEWLER
jgi:hypothetical protein